MGFVSIKTCVVQSSELITIKNFEIFSLNCTSGNEQKNHWIRFHLAFSFQGLRTQVFHSTLNLKGSCSKLNYFNFYLDDTIFKICKSLHWTKFAIQGPESVTDCLAIFFRRTIQAAHREQTKWYTIIDSNGQ